MLLVVAYHAGVPLFTGGFVGVDVFFVLSGYLITSLLLREHERAGRIDFLAFFGRRIRRLLPAAALVVLCSAILGAAIYGPLEQMTYARSAIAASAYVSNFWFAKQAGDYFARGAADDPLLHMWSLSVEEQFYIIWPLTLAGILLVATTRAKAAWLTVAVTVLSFLPALWFAHAARVTAFYFTPLRGWEFGAGALLSIMPTAARMPLAACRAAAVAGGIAIVGSAMYLTSNHTFPGGNAVPVVVGTVLVLLPGHVGAFRVSLLEMRVLQRFGKLSYSWYLWHWPVLVGAAVLLPAAGWATRSLIGLAALIPAALAYRYVEMPLRYNSWLLSRGWRSVAFGVVLSVSTAAVMGANHLRAGRLSRSPEFVQIREASRSGPIEMANCIARTTGPATECDFGSEDGLPVVLYGDSHASHWGAALIPIARMRGWHLTVLTKRSCPTADVAVQRSQGRRNTDCETWRQAAMSRIAEIRPALVIMSHSQTYVQGATILHGEPFEEWEAGLGRIMDNFESLGAAVVLLQDNPRFQHSVPDCLARRFAWAARDTSCDTPRSLGVNGQLLEVERTYLAERKWAATIDLTQHFCTDAVCPAVVDGIVAYRDHHHISAAMAAHLIPTLENALQSALIGMDRADLTGRKSQTT